MSWENNQVWQETWWQKTFIPIKSKCVLEGSGYLWSKFLITHSREFPEHTFFGRASSQVNKWVHFACVQLNLYLFGILKIDCLKVLVVQVAP